MKKILFLSLLSLFANSCAQVALTGNIVNVTVIKAQDSKDDSIMTGSDIEGLATDLTGGELTAPLK